MSDKKPTYSLISLAERTRELTDKLMQTGEVTEEIEALLPLQETQLPAKVEAYVFTMAQLEMQADYFGKKSKEFAQAAKTFEATLELMKDRVKTAARILDLNEIVGTDHRFVIYNSNPSVEVVDESKIDKSYTSEVITRKIDKKRIAEDLALGIPVEGAVLKQGKSLKISLNKKVIA